MKRTQKECEALIDETVEYFKTHNRATNEDSCYYFDTETEAMCAVGRCLAEPKRFAETFCDVKHLVPLNGGDEIFREEYQGYPQELWFQIQRLHDGSHHWDGNKLTKKGEARVNYLKSELWVN